MKSIANRLSTCFYPFALFKTAFGIAAVRPAHRYHIPDYHHRRHNSTNLALFLHHRILGPAPAATFRRHALSIYAYPHPHRVVPLTRAAARLRVHFHILFVRLIHVCEEERLYCDDIQLTMKAVVYSIYDRDMCLQCVLCDDQDFTLASPSVACVPRKSSWPPRLPSC